MTRNTILVPLDGSAMAETAVWYAASLAETRGDTLRLLTVVERMGKGEYAQRIEGLVEEGLRSHLHAVAERLRADGLIVETAIRTGSPPETIIADAAGAHPWAIVLCARGMTGVDRWPIGGVADKVVRLAACPVLLVHPDGQAAGVLWPPRRIIVPLDGSARAEQALPLAYELAAAFNAGVELVRVQPWTAAQVAAYGGYIADIAALDECAAREADAYLSGVCGRAPSDIPVSRIVLRGSPAAQIADYADQTGVGAIVIASRGQDGGRRMLLGSVTDRLIRHGVPILVVHPVEADPAQAAAVAADDVPATAPA